MAVIDRGIFAAVIARGRSYRIDPHTARPATRAPHLAAELLESRCMLSIAATLENNISMFDRISVSHPSMRLPANPGGSFVGQFFWNGSGFNSFCVEIGQSISPGLHTFPTVTSLSASGVANAGPVEQFWRSYGPTAPTGFSSVTDAAAFQLGLWELISDGASRNLKSGSFNVGGSASPAVALAESWLNGTGAPAPGAGGSVALHVMQHPTLQDQVIWGPLPPPSVSVKVTPTTGVTEDGPNALTYAFTASPAPTADITVNYRIGGSATAGSDFTTVLPPGATTGTITIRAGSTSPVTLRIVPKADTEIERDETVVITLQNGTGYALGTSVATGTITNDDLPAVTLAVSHAGVMEDGTTNLVYTFTRTGPPTSRLTVNYGITGTADGADYSGATPGTGKTISFDPGFDKATVTIDPTPDTEIEFNETVILTLAAGSGYTFDTTRPPATGTIENDDLNRPPQFAAYSEHNSGEWDTSSDDYVFGTGEVIAHLDAYDTDRDPLTYSGGSNFLQVLPDGRVYVTDGPGLSTHFDSEGGAIQFPVSVTDGITVAVSQFVLDKKLSWIDQTEIHMQTSNGHTYKPATATALINVLQTIRTNKDTVATLIIKGHGGPDGIQVGDDGDFLTTPNNGNNIYIGDTDDVTTLLKDVTDGETSIYFRGCWTRQLVRKVQVALDGARCYGSVFFVIGIPGTRWTIGPYR